MDGPTVQSDLIDAYGLRVAVAGRAALVELGGLVQDDLHQRLSIAYPPASNPGEDPHRRTGQLAAGITPNVTAVAGGHQLDVTSVRDGGNPNVSKFLNEGTSKMAPRPFATNAGARWRRSVVPVVTDSMRNQLS